MKILIGLAIALSSVTASAQTTVAGTGMNSPNYSTYQTSVTGRIAPSDTPTQRADKLKRAIALRTETQALLKQDGGELTTAHEAYVRRESCKILGVQGARSASLVPKRGCGI